MAQLFSRGRNRAMRVKRLLLLIALLSIATHRLPAPILETQESPTPKPEQSAKPRPKRTAKPKASEGSESSTNKRATSPTPSPLRNPFDGTWVGTFKNMPLQGDVELAITISGSGTVESDTAKFHKQQYRATCDGRTTKWIDSWCTWTLTPNIDGKTAIATCDGGGILGMGAYHSAVVFRRTSP
jgi:hypothetical protein